MGEVLVVAPLAIGADRLEELEPVALVGRGVRVLVHALFGWHPLGVAAVSHRLREVAPLVVLVLDPQAQGSAVGADGLDRLEPVGAHLFPGEEELADVDAALHLGHLREAAVRAPQLDAVAVRLFRIGQHVVPRLSLAELVDEAVPVAGLVDVLVAVAREPEEAAVVALLGDEHVGGDLLEDLAAPVGRGQRHETAAVGGPKAGLVRPVPTRAHLAFGALARARVGPGDLEAEVTTRQ